MNHTGQTDPDRVSDPAREARSADAIHHQVRSDYAKVAQASDSRSCCEEASGYCGVAGDVQINALPVPIR